MENGHDLNHMLHKATRNWLSPDEVHFILQNHHPGMIQDRVHQMPAPGSLFLFNRNNISCFRRDGHSWRKKPRRNSVNESHENLKVGDAEALACYYAKGAEYLNLRRRIFWMLGNKDIVLVHYLDKPQGNTSSASILEGSTGQSYTITQSVVDGYQSLGSPLSLEITSRVAQQRMEHLPSSTADENVVTLPEFEMCQTVQELQDQINSNCNIDEQTIVFGNEKQNVDNGMASGFSDSLTWQDIAILTAPQGENIEAFSERNLRGTNMQDNHSMLLDPILAQVPPKAPEPKFEIIEISPKWCFADEVTKVIVIGTFCYDPLETLYAMFGDIKVPAQFIQNGVICCQAPSNSPGKVSFCITSGNRDSCSQLTEFEYRDMNSVLYNCVKPHQQEERRTEESKLLFKFLGMLSADSSMQELLEDKLHHWLATRFLQADNKSSCTLSKKERGIIHLVAALGYSWALNTILETGVGINIRDSNGWTALHWAARYGREEMVAALIARGASVSAVTDPTAQDPMGKNAAFIADANGHRGLAASLSAYALTSQFSDLTIEKEDVGSSASNEILDEDQSSMNQVLEASKMAAERIQHAYRIYSFRRKQQREVAKCGEEDDYGLTLDEARCISAAVSPRPKYRGVAAVTIQKYYRGWKGRTHFLTMRNKAIKIQAHVRGYQFRKYYRVIRVVSIMEKIMLRWRLKRRGLRGFKLQGEAMEEEEDEDIFKDFRKKKLDTTVNEALQRLRNLEQCPEARGQCGRMLRAFRVAKARLGVSSEALDTLNGINFGEKDNADFDGLGRLPLQDRPVSQDCLSYLSELL